MPEWRVPCGERVLLPAPCTFLLPSPGATAQFGGAGGSLVKAGPRSVFLSGDVHPGRQVRVTSWLPWLSQWSCARAPSPHPLCRGWGSFPTWGVGPSLHTWVKPSAQAQGRVRGPASGAQSLLWPSPSLPCQPSPCAHLARTFSFLLFSLA